MANPPNPQPTGNTPWVQGPRRQDVNGSDQLSVPTTIFLLYMQSLDKVVRNLAAGVVGPLPQAANDAAAAKAGVPLQGLYRNGNAVQIRLT